MDGGSGGGYVPPEATVAPDLRAVGRTVTEGSVQVVFVFDEAAVLTGGTGLFVYAPDGTRTALSGCARGSQPIEVVCAADRGSALGRAMEAAGLAAIERGAMADTNGFYAAHPDSQPL